MANGKYEITEEIFKSMKPADREWIMFTTFNEQRVTCNRRFQKIEKRKFINTAASSAGGFLGGIIAVIGKAKIFG